MSNLRFIIDAVPTPRIDLASAFMEDLEYYIANKRTPPLGRSALSRAEEALNNYLKYVNESFIQGGFSSSSAEVSAAADTAVDTWANNGTVTFTTTIAQTANLNIQPEDKANIHFGWSLCGSYYPAETEADGNTEYLYGDVVVELWLDAVKMREWRQRLVDGYNTVGAGICFANQAKGSHIIHLRVKVTQGSLAVASNYHYAWGYGQIAR